MGAAALNGVLRGVGDPRAALDAAALAALINVFLDVVLVWQLGLNPNGAAIATACAEWVALIYLAARFAKRSNGVEALPLGKGLETFTTAALATLVRTLCLQAFLAATTAFISVTSADPTLLAAHLVLKQFYIIMSFVTDALAIAAQQLVASATSTLEARKRATRLLGWGFVTGVVLAAALRDSSVLTHGRCKSGTEASIELLRIVAPLQLLSSSYLWATASCKAARLQVRGRRGRAGVGRRRRGADPGTAAARRPGDGVGRRRRAERPAV